MAMPPLNFSLQGPNDQSTFVNQPQFGDVAGGTVQFGAKVASPNLGDSTGAVIAAAVVAVVGALIWARKKR